MNLYETIKAEKIRGMKTKDQVLSTLASVVIGEVDRVYNKASGDDIDKTVISRLKSLHEQNQLDLTTYGDAVYQRQLDILTGWMPVVKMLSEDEIKVIIDAKYNEVKVDVNGVAVPNKEMMKIILPSLKTTYGSTMNMKFANTYLSSLLV